MYFPLRPPHRIHEPAHGYVLRLVETNGYAWRGCKLVEVGADLGVLARGQDFEFACLNGRADPAQLAFSTPQPCGTGRYRLCGQTLHQSQLVFGRKRFCAACWAEDRSNRGPDGLASPYLRCWWSVAAMTACPIHSTKLTDRCHACDRATTFQSGGLKTCRCGADLIRARGAHANDGAVSADVFIAGRLAGLPSSEVPMLDHLDLGDAVLLLQRLGCIAQPGRTVRLSEFAQQDRAPLLRAGLEMCMLGENAVEAAIGRYLDATGRTDAFKSALGPFYAWVNDLDPSPSRDWLVERLAAVFRIRHFQWAERRGDGSHHPTAERVTLREAGKLLELSHTPTRRVLETIGLLPDAARRSIRHTVDRSRVVEIRRVLDGLVDVPDAASRLGINARSVLALASGGILPRSALGQQAFGDATMFDSDDIDALLTRLRGSAASVVRVPPGGMAVPDASRFCGMVRLCRRILDGMVSPLAVIVDVAGLKGIVVSRDAAMAPDDAATRPHFTAGAARRRLRLREATMTGLLAAGHIRSEPGPGSRKLVAKCDVEAFDERYVTSSELARRWRTNTSNVLTRMRDADHPPSIEFDRSDRTEVRFFDRTAAAAIAPILREPGRRARAKMRVQRNY